MSKVLHRRCGLLVLLLAVSVSACEGEASRIRQETRAFIARIPPAPGSVLLSESEDRTRGADPTCDGHIVSRLYGTDDSIEAAIEYIADACFELDESAVYAGSYSEPTLGLRFTDDYLLVVYGVALTPELLRDPFFMHKEVDVDQPFETIYQVAVSHGDPDQLEHCLGIP
jgi:hypothetical protein